MTTQEFEIMEKNWEVVNEIADELSAPDRDDSSRVDHDMDNELTE